MFHRPYPIVGVGVTIAAVNATRPAVFLVLALLISACSGDSAPPETPAPTTRAPVPTTTTTTTTTTPPTTTTTTTTTEPPAAAVVNGQIGVVGCSNTAMAAAGYDVASDLDLLTQGGLTGGSVGIWGNDGPRRYDRYWGMYDDRRPGAGYAAAWVQLCIRTTEHGGSFSSDIQRWIEHIVDEIHERDPGIPIWISPVNTFEEGHLCPTIGEEGPAIAAEAADWAAETIDVVDRGPDIGPVLVSQFDPGEACHPNFEGQAVLGAQLVEFFDTSG